MDKKEKSIVMVSHDMEFIAKYADEISLLYQGEIIVQCPVRGFMEENQFYTTGMNRVTRRVNPHIITIEDVKKYAKEKIRNSILGILAFVLLFMKSLC